LNYTRVRRGILLRGRRFGDWL